MPKNSHTTVLHVCVAAPCKTPILAVFFYRWGHAPPQNARRAAQKAWKSITAHRFGGPTPHNSIIQKLVMISKAVLVTIELERVRKNHPLAPARGAPLGT